MGTPQITAEPPPPSSSARDASRLSDLSAQQWKSGIAAWLGWLFDGLDMHLYLLVAAPFVAELLGVSNDKDPLVGYYGSWIQAAFLIGWALGGGFFGRIGDRLGRSRALMLTILTYALFTGLSYFAHTWWELLIYRFLAALGIGGEWAIGASLLSETWPRRWRPWLAAILQTGVNLGVVLAALAAFLLAESPRSVFLVGVLPALLVLWIRRAVPETDEWKDARQFTISTSPGFRELFRGSVRRTTVLTILVCSLSLTAHWAFLFWYLQHLRSLPELRGWDPAEMNRLVSKVVWLVTLTSMAGNFLAGGLARWLKYRWAIACLCVAYCLSMVATYSVPLTHQILWCGLMVIGLCHGVFALFTMYLPPLFPTLLRTTGAGFCYNIGRIAAGLGTVFFGLVAPVGDYRLALLWAGFLFLPAAGIALLLPEPPDEQGTERLIPTPPLCAGSSLNSSLTIQGEPAAPFQGQIRNVPER